MKKSLCLFLALTLFLSISSFACAANPTFTQTWSSNSNKNITAENTGFTVAADAANPAEVNVTCETDSESGKTTIRYPSSYASAGEYKYAITQNSGSTQGMNYDSGIIHFCILVTKNKSGESTANAYLYSDGTAAKKEGFENTYEVRSLSITQSVSGNTVNAQEEFDVSVTITPETGKAIKYDLGYSSTNSESGEIYSREKDAITKSFKMKPGEKLTIYNIPVGVTYSVQNTSDNGYQATYTNGSGTVGSEDINVSITNERNSDLNVGVVLEYAPYVVILAVVAAGVVILILRQKKENREV